MSANAAGHCQPVETALLYCHGLPSHSGKPLELRKVHNTPVVVHLLHALAMGGIKSVILCVNAAQYEDIKACVQSQRSLQQVSTQFVPLPAARHTVVQAVVACRHILPKRAFMVVQTNRVFANQLVALLRSALSDALMSDKCCMLVDDTPTAVPDDAFSRLGANVTAVQLEVVESSAALVKVVGVGSLKLTNAAIDTGLAVFDQQLLRYLDSLPEAQRQTINLSQVLQSAAAAGILYAVRTGGLGWGTAIRESQLTALHPLFNQIQSSARALLPHADEVGEDSESNSVSFTRGRSQNRTSNSANRNGVRSRTNSSASASSEGLWSHSYLDEDFEMDQGGFEHVASTPPAYEMDQGGFENTASTPPAYEGSQSFTGSVMPRMSPPAAVRAAAYGSANNLVAMDGNHRSGLIARRTSVSQGSTSAFRPRNELVGVQRVAQMKKARSIAALSELEKSATDNRKDALIRLNKDFNKLTQLVRKREGGAVKSPYFKLTWYLAILSNCLLGILVFWKHFFVVMKKGVNARTIFRELLRRQPIRKMVQKPSKAQDNIARGIYSTYNRGGLEAARWSSPLFLFALLLSRVDPCSETQPYTVFIACIYSSVLPSVTQTRRDFCWLNIGSNVLFVLSRFFKMISGFEDISF